MKNINREVSKIVKFIESLGLEVVKQSHSSDSLINKGKHKNIEVVTGRMSFTVVKKVKIKLTDDDMRLVNEDKESDDDDDS